MNKIKLIIWREFITRVRKPSFLIMTLLAPVLAVLLVGAINPRPWVGLRLLIWRSPEWTIGSWIALAAGGGAAEGHGDGRTNSKDAEPKRMVNAWHWQVVASCGSCGCSPGPAAWWPACNTGLRRAKAWSCQSIKRYCTTWSK